MILKRTFPPFTFTDLGVVFQIQMCGLIWELSTKSIHLTRFWGALAVYKSLC